MKKISRKKKMLGIFSALLLVVGIALPTFINPKNASAWECKNRNVIRCGVSDQGKQDLVNQITNGDGTHTDIKTIFNAIGIYPDDIMSEETVGGVMRRDGSVWVGSTQVASNVVMGQRGTEGIEGESTAFVGLNWAYAQNMFAQGVEQEGAFVRIHNGKFMYAIMVSCGNPVLSTLAGIPPHISITKEVRNVTDDPNSQFVKSTNADPGETVRYRVRVNNDAEVTAESVAISDILPPRVTLVPGSAEVKTTQLVNGAWQDVTTPMADGDVTGGKVLGNFLPSQDAYLTFNAQVATSQPSGCNTLVNTGVAQSSQTVTIRDTANVVVCVTTPQPPPTPPTPPTPTPPSSPTPSAPIPISSVTPVTAGKLPVSGPVEAVGGVMGTAGLGYAGYLWRRSRKTLIDTLKKW